MHLLTLFPNNTVAKDPEPLGPDFDETRKRHSCRQPRVGDSHFRQCGHPRRESESVISLSKSKPCGSRLAVCERIILLFQRAFRLAFLLPLLPFVVPVLVGHFAKIAAAGKTKLLLECVTYPRKHPLSSGRKFVNKFIRPFFRSG